MNRPWAALLIAMCLAAAVLLLTAITPATGTPPAAAGRIPASEFVALRSAGITASGNPPTIPALHQPRTPAPRSAPDGALTTPGIPAVGDGRDIPGRTEVPPSGVGQAAVLSPARDPSNGRESPRHRPALRGAETAGGGASPSLAASEFRNAAPRPVAQPSLFPVARRPEGPTAVAVTSPPAECREWALGCGRYPALATVGPSSPFGCRAARPQFWGALGAESQPCGVRDGGLNAGRSLTASAPASTGLSAARPGTIRTIASWMPERYGADYLALPEGAGHRVTICGAAACVTLTSCDAGPDKAMQRAGRTVDLGVLTWEYVTGLPRSRGLAWVTVRRE